MKDCDRNGRLELEKDVHELTNPNKLRHHEIRTFTSRLTA